MTWLRELTFHLSSAYDQITQQPVAIKKMMSPFASSAIAKRTYREVKLLKKLRHENVRPRQRHPFCCSRLTSDS